MRGSSWLASVFFVAACSSSQHGDIESNVQQCTLEDDASVCSAPTQAITASADEVSAPSVSAGVTYAITTPAAQHAYVVLTPATTGTHTLYFGDQEPSRVCDEEAQCASPVTSCGGFHRAAQYTFTAGLPYVIELDPGASSLLHVIEPQMPPIGGPKLAAPALYSTTGTFAGYISVADLNSDGSLDVVVSNADDAGGSTWIDVMRGSGTGSFAPASRVLTSLPQKTVVSDFDGDGNADIAGISADGMGPLPNFYLQGTGNFMFTKTTWLTNIEFRGSLEGADFDEDGVVDLVASFATENSPPPMRGGFMIVKMPGFQVVQDEDVFVWQTSDVITGDFNGDGHQDVIVSKRDAPVVRLYVGDGTGTVTFDRQLSLPLGSGATRLIALDLDGNGYTDFVAFNAVLDGASVTLSSATGFASQSLPRARPGATAGDFDRDGIIDLVVSDTQQGVLNFYRGTGTGFVLDGTVAGSFRSCCMASVDVNGDGRLDLVTSALTSTGGAIAVYLGTP